MYYIRPGTGVTEQSEAMMKKYLVIRVFKYSAPDVAFMSDDLDRAKMWAEAMSAEDHREYVVVSTEELLRLKPEEE